MLACTRHHDALIVLNLSNLSRNGDSCRQPLHKPGPVLVCMPPNIAHPLYGKSRLGIRVHSPCNWWCSLASGGEYRHQYQTPIPKTVASIKCTTCALLVQRCPSAQEEKHITFQDQLKIHFTSATRSITTATPWTLSVANVKHVSAVLLVACMAIGHVAAAADPVMGDEVTLQRLPRSLLTTPCTSVGYAPSPTFTLPHLPPP